MTEFVVHSRQNTIKAVPIETKDGKKMTAAQKTAVIELVADGLPTRTLHLSIESDEEVAAADIFQVGNKVREGEYTLVEKAEA